METLLIIYHLRDGQNKAWNSPMLASTEEPSSFSNANAPTSFLAIQQQQLNAYSSSARSKPKSLREIQEDGVPGCIHLCELL